MSRQFKGAQTKKNFIYEFTEIFVMKPILKEIHSLSVKISYFQNEFMKTSFLPKYKRKNEGRNPDNFSFVFWEKQWIHKFILKLSDLYEQLLWLIMSIN